MNARPVSAIAEIENVVTTTNRNKQTLFLTRSTVLTTTDIHIKTIDAPRSNARIQGPVPSVRYGVIHIAPTNSRAPKTIGGTTDVSVRTALIDCNSSHHSGASSRPCSSHAILLQSHQSSLGRGGVSGCSGFSVETCRVLWQDQSLRKALSG